MIQSFMETQGLVVQKQTGNLTVSHATQIFIDKSIAYHFGTLQNEFAFGDLDEALIENADETYFVFDMDND